MKFLHIIVFISMLFFSLYAQEWDEISDEELAMTDFPEYPEADAVILFDLGQLEITRDFDLEKSRHVRIKVLTEKGKESADVFFLYRNSDDITDLEAHAYTPDGEEYELDDDDVHHQEYDDMRMCRFSIPGVVIGSIIEYRYEIVRENILFLDPWYFQNEEFTVLSQLSVNMRPGFNYTAFPENVWLYDYQFEDQEYFDIDTKKKNKRFIWRMRNIPPLKREKFMYNFDDYLAKIYFQMVSYKDQYQSFSYIDSWDDLSKRFVEVFEEPIDMDKGLEELTLQLIADATTEKEKIEKIHTFLLDSIKTIDDMDLWAFKNPDEVLEKRAGVPSSKNLMLLNMLQHANIKAYPVMISTRSHGRLRAELPQILQFNHLLVQVTVDKKPMYLDSSDEFCPCGVIPTECDVSRGLLVKENSGQIINIATKNVKSIKQINTDILLNSDGLMTAKSSFKLEGYFAYYLKGEIKSKSLREFGEERLEESFEDFYLDTIWVEDQEKPGTLVFHMKYQIKNYVEDAGNMIYMSAPFLTKTKNNPLKSETRNYPVDYDNTFSELEAVKIHLADNMSIMELPHKIKDNSRFASYSNFAFKGEKEFEVNRHFAIKKVSFQPSEYKDLRRIYHKMINSDQNQIVIAVN